MPPRSDVVFKVRLRRVEGAGKGIMGFPYRLFKRFLRWVAKTLIRLNLLWQLIKAFEKKTHFFESIAVFLRLKQSREYDEEELPQTYHDDNIEYDDDSEVKKDVLI